MLLIYCTQLLPTGGIESHILEFCKQIHAQNVKIDLLVFNSSISEKQKEHYRFYCNRLFLIESDNKIIRFLKLVNSCLKLRSNNYSAIYTNGQGDSMSFINHLLGKNKKWVHHHHTSGDLIDQAGWTPKYIKMMKKADRVIACSHTNASNMNIALNRNIDVVYCFSRAVEIAQVNRKKNKQTHLGYFGRLIKEKGIVTICKMSEVPEFSDIVFHIWGSASTYDEVFFQQYPKVQYYGKFDGLEGLKQTLSILDGFLLLSTHSEGLPISLLEVMSSGIPWFATDKGGISDIAFDEFSTKVIPADSSYKKTKSAVLEFTKHIKEGKTSPEKLKSMYQEKFSANILVQKWISILSL